MTSSDKVDINRALAKIKAGKYLQANKDKIIAKYDEVTAQDKSGATRRHYLEKLHALAEYYPDTAFKDMTVADMQKYKGVLADKYAPASVWLHMVLCRVFLRGLGSTAMDWFSPKTDKLKSRLEAHQILNETEIMKMVNAVEGLKNKTVLFVGWESTARNSELCNLSIKDVVFDEHSIKLVLNGKTGKRDAYLIGSAPLLREYLEHYHFDKDNPEAPLFYSTSKNKYGRMTRNGYYFVCSRAAKAAKINKPIFPHALRYSRALWCALHKINEVMMRKMFGWSRSSNQPSRYADMASSDVRDTLLQEAGIKETKKGKEFPPVVCPKCETANTYGSKTCKKCWYVLGFVEAADRDTEIKKREDKLLKLLQHPKVAEAAKELEL